MPRARAAQMPAGISPEELRRLIAGRPKLPVSAEPIVKGAKWTLRCACGMARDSNAETRQAALDEFRRDHDKRHTDISIDSVDYSEHPLMKGARR